jgi:hypothetical protein
MAPGSSARAPFAFWAAVSFSRRCDISLPNETGATLHIVERLVGVLHRRIGFVADDRHPGKMGRRNRGGTISNGIFDERICVVSECWGAGNHNECAREYQFPFHEVLPPLLEAGKGFHEVSALIIRNIVKNPGKTGNCVAVSSYCLRDLRGSRRRTRKPFGRQS